MMVRAQPERKGRWLVTAIMVALLGAACANPASEVGVATAPPAVETLAPTPDPATPDAAEQTLLVETPAVATADPAEGGPTLEAEPAAEVFVVTEELYERTFDEIQTLIAHLNGIIREQDFIAWSEFLTPEYVVQSSDPQYLRRLTERGPLKRNNIELHGLEDFFTHVVVPSRSDVVLDSVEFVDENLVKAISLTTLGPGVLYYLVRSAAGWQISVF
jgi:hypothetical protein